MFMEIAIGAIGIGIVLMVGYVIISQVVSALPTPQKQYPNSCYGLGLNLTGCGSTATYCAPVTDNTSRYLTCDNVAYTSGLSSTQTTVFAGFGLVAVGIIVLAAFGLINIFK